MHAPQPRSGTPATPLADAFLAALPGGADDAHRAELQALLAAAARDGQRHWDVALCPRAYAVYLAERVGAAEPMRVTALCTLDLYLACGCASGDPAALTRFELRYRPDIDASLRQVPDAAPLAEDITQTVLERLLVQRPDGRRGITSYRGRGALHAWLRVVAVRAAVRELRRRSRETPLSDEDLAAAVAAGPDTALLNRACRAEFRRAFHATLAALAPAQRALLRQHYLHGFTIDQLGAVHRIHRATAARRLARAREQLLAGTREHMRERLGLDDAALDSMLAVIASRLEVSLERALATQEP